jgi:hypothetical protein
MGASPLHECEYVAAYEEAEAVRIAVHYLKTMGDAAPRGVRMLLAYVEFLLNRGRNYFPENLPANVVSNSPKDGKIDRHLAIPLEDLSNGWKQAGQVGQEVYGSSVSFVACVSSYLNYANAQIMVFSEYPILEDKGQFASDGSGIIEMRLGGTPDFSCKIRVLAKGSMQLLQRVSVEAKNNKTAVALPQALDHNFTEYQVAGGSELRINVASAGVSTAKLAA